MFDDFLVRAGLAGVGLALAAGPLGCFVVWRRMAYFGDAVAHAAILGVALSRALSIGTAWGVLAAALAMGLAVNGVAGRGLAADTMLGVAAHSALALGLVAAALVGGANVDLAAYLFGDILTTTTGDLAVIWGGAAAVLALLGWRWQALLAATLNADLAAAAGVDARREQRMLTLALAIVVAMAIKVVGALLIGALLIVPAATARGFARTPEAMAAGAGALGILAVLAGLAASYQWDAPTGPTIVTAAAAMFLVGALLGRIKK